MVRSAKTIRQYIHERKRQTRRGIELWNRYTPRVSERHTEAGNVLSIAPESLSAWYRRTVLASWRWNLFLTVFIASGIGFIIGVLVYSGNTPFLMEPADQKQVIAFGFLAAMLVTFFFILIQGYYAYRSAGCHRFFHLIIAGSECGIWESPRQTVQFKGKKNELSCKAEKPGYKKPYGLGLVKISVRMIDELTGITVRFERRFKLADKDVDAIITYKRANGLKGVSSVSGLNKLYGDFRNADAELIYAAQAGNADRVKTLIDIGYDVNILPIWGPEATALMEAARNGHVTVAEILLKNGADLSIETKHGRQAWSFVKKSQRAEFERLFSAYRPKRVPEM